jgi:hypothetical protein
MKRMEKYLLLLAVALPVWVSSSAFASCSSPKNTIEAENCLPGTPQSQWDISGAGDSTIQGFATSISVNQGQTVSFKINTNATSYKLDIYRLGYYGGNGARLITTVQPSATLPQSQPTCITDSATALMDCGNWAVSASWAVPASATSGIYFAKVARTDTGGASHVPFIVRNDSSTSDILFKTSDTTWQAYNDYGGANLYTGGPGPQGGAYKVSYNRPFHTRVYEFYSWIFNAEYPMVRFLEANAYDVTYFTSLDADISGSLMLQHKAVLSVGHDEYWSGNERTMVENARAAGVHLAFFSGNEIFWKTRWEPSIDGTNTPNRTLVCYKETHANKPTDPLDPPTWTGTWRDPRFSPPADGGRPENGLSGTIFMVNGLNPAEEIQVPQSDGQMRLWRNTAPASLAAGQTYSTSFNVLGYEWDIDADNGFRPAGLFDLSTATYNISGKFLLDYGSTYGNGTATHHLTTYRYTNGSHSALVFSTGTSQWAWGLDANHDGGTTTPDQNLQQATVNLFADMAIQPATLLAGLVPASASTDTVPPTSTITTPTSGSSVQAGSLITITGTASDAGGGVVGGVEVSTDGGNTWHPATGRNSWTYNWTPATSGSATIKSRAVDDSGNLENPTAVVTVTIASRQCPCSIWGSGATPGTIDSTDPGSVELGVRFRADVNGFITGMRFYKASTNTGTHIGNLWSNTGTLLATATFSGESTSGWQQVNFTSPVAVTANTTYVASYFDPRGHYSADDGFFATTGVDNTPLHALVDGLDGGNGAYIYSGSSAFPNATYQSSNYWVDVVFTTNSGGNTTPPTVVSTNPANGAIGVNPATTVTAVFSEAIDPTTINGNTFQLLGPGQSGSETNTVVPATVTYTAATQTATLTPTSALAASTNYTAELVGGSSGVKDLAGNALVGNYTWSFTTAATAGTCPCTIWGPSATPAAVDSGDGSAVELGLRFRSDVAGTITGIRFYKAATNGGTHTGHLWNNTGTLLGSATFSQETASGWQAVSFSTPIQITANTTYVASYFAPLGHYSDDLNYFAGTGTDNAPLHALQTGVDGANGVYNYGSVSSFPTSTYQATNYWVDVVFAPLSSTTPPTVNAVTPANQSSGVILGPSVTATFNEPMTTSTINATTFTLVDASSNSVPATIAYNAGTSTATLTPTVELSPSTTYMATIHGGSAGVKDFNGNAMVSDYSWSFTTGAAPANSGPGGPILVISNVLNPFSRYYGEILSAEGLNEYLIADISTVTPTTLGNYDLAILSDMSLTSAQVTMLMNWVNGGGKLIAMHPDKQLAGLLGLAASSSMLSNAYLLVNNSTGPGTGIVGQTIQFHGTADLYSLSGASSVATLYSSATTSTASPAVTLANAGAGQAAAFTYDLARSIVYTRQGNPAWSGQKRDGQIPPIRSDDLFFGAASFDPEPDWVDLTKVSIPQADEQQRLLANLILQMDEASKPLPRFWYFPSGFKAVVVMTGDDHGSFYSGSATSNRFSDYTAASPTGCSVPDWQCVRATSYVFPQALATNPLTDSQVAAFTAQGFEVSVHVDSSPTCSNWTSSELDAQYTSLLASLASQFPSNPAPQTHRMHCIGWSDYDSQPQVELKHGIRFDTSYYYWPPTWVNNQPGLFTGSGMPMRFTDRNGNIIDVYQATTQMTDESGQSYPFNIDTILGNAVGTSGYYGAFVVQAHDDQGSYPGIAPDVVASAQANGVPIVSSLQMLTWLDGRNNSSFGALAWSGNTLSFNINQASGARNLQAMLPTNGPSGTLSSITRGGSAVSFTTQTIKGVSYGVFSATSGFYQATYGGGAPAVVLSSVTLNPASVVGGSGSTGTVTLSGPAPTGGALVTLSSSNTAVAQVPASVTVSSSGTVATFSVTTSSVASTTQVTIQGTYGSTQGTTLTVLPPSAVLASVTLNPTSVTGGASSTGTVTLSAAAPSGGAVVTLSSGNPAATVPASVTVPAGSTSTTFTVTTSGVASQTSAVITATYGVSGNATLTINPAVVSTVTLNPTSVTGGSNSTGTVTLNGVAPGGGAVVTLSSSNTAAAQVPATVTISGGSTSTTFTVTTSAVATTTTSSISATYGATASATLTVKAVQLSSLSLSPTSVVGGNNSTGTVRLGAAAPTGGAVVTLSSSNTAAATVPASVTVPAGSTSATFTVTTLGVAANTTSIITGTLGVSASATLTVTAASLSSVTRSPSSVVGGNNSTGTVTLNGAAPPSGAVVTLSSSNTSAAQVPASVTIVAGSRSATFTITTTPVTANTSVTISATYGVTRTTTLTVNAPTLSSLTRSPTSVVGGNNSTGTVTLNGAAPAGGAVVTLSSSNTAAAQVPASVTIAANSTSTTFTITTSGVASSTSVTISAVYGTTRTTTLTVTVASLTSLTLNPNTVTGGSSSTGTLTLNGAAPPNGAVVSLTSSNTTAAQVPSTATIPAGASNITFTVTTGAVHGTSSTIRATYGSTTRSATLTVQ